MVQTVIKNGFDVAFLGMRDGVGPLNVRSYAAEEVIPLGHPVMLGTNKEKQVLKATTGAAAIGFSLHDHSREQTNADVVQFGISDAVGVLNMGRIWVETNDAVVAGAVANLVVANGKLTDASVAAGIEAFTQITVRFVTSTTAAGLALIEVK